MQQFNDANFNRDVLQSGNPVVVDFWSTGCGQPCNDTLAMLHTLEPQYPIINLGTLLTNDNPVTTAQYTITAFPTVIIYNHGVVVNRFDGAPTMAQLVAALNALGPVREPRSEPETVDVSINLPQDEIDPRDLDRLLEAVDEFMEAMGFELKSQEEPVQGSWSQNLEYKDKNYRTQQELSERFEKAKAALESTYLTESETQATNVHADVAAKLITAAERFDAFAIRVGPILLVRGMHQGKSTLLVITISPQLQIKLDANPHILLDPSATLKLFSEIQSPQLPLESPSSEPDPVVP